MQINDNISSGDATRSVPLPTSVRSVPDTPGVAPKKTDLDDVSSPKPSKNIPLTGPEAIEYALSRINLEEEEQRHRSMAKDGPKSKRGGAIKALNAIEGLKRNELRPEQLLIRNVPVIPPSFRPFSVVGDTFVAGDANELYRDLFQYRDIYKESHDLFGREGASDAALDLYDTTKALYGFGQPIAPKTRQRSVSGFLKQVTGCHDDETEILTKKGWVKFPFLTEDVDVATINPDTFHFEWQRPTKYQHYRYKGCLMAFKKGKRVDMLVTPDHRMWLKIRDKKNKALEKEITDGWHIKPAWQIANNGNRKWFQTAALGWKGEFTPPSFALHVPEASFAHLVGLYLAEGWLKRDNGICVCQCPNTNPDVCDFIRETLDAFQLEYLEETLEREPGGFNSKPSTQIRWTLYFSDLNKWLKENCGTGSKDKFLSEAIRNWPSELLRALLLGYLAGDGSKRLKDFSKALTHAHKLIEKEAKTSSYVGFTTASDELFDNLSEICVKVGLSVHEGRSEEGLRYAGLIHRKFTSSEEPAELVTDYDGYVHCCTVDNGLLITRRNGHIVVSGNSGPKFSFFQNKMIGKNQDNVARGTIAIDPELELDEIGIPKEMAWKMYAPYIQRRLVQAGMSPGAALMEVQERSDSAMKALQREVLERPVIYSRAPSWHKFNVIAGKPKLVDGDTIKINPLITPGMNADFDGDAMNLHVPAMPESVKEAHEKLMPSKMLWSVRDRDKTMPVPAQEMILGLYTAARRKAKNTHVFNSEQEALAAIKRGEIELSDDIEINGR